MEKLTNIVRAEMNKALKSGDKETKQVYSGILDALNKEAKALLVAELTAEQEVDVIKRLLKQADDAIAKCPASRPEYADKFKFEKSILMQYMPKQMDSDEIMGVINEVLSELDISEPTKSDKGKVMKALMPKVKGKADGKLVNDIFTTYLG